MKNYYSNSIEYHNDLDRYEARARAEQEESDCQKCFGTGYKRISPTILATCDHDEDEKCTCLEYAGDDAECPVHGSGDTMTSEDFEAKMARGLYFPLDGSDTSMKAQLEDAGFGSGGVL